MPAPMSNSQSPMRNLPVALAGFSFGAYCQTRVGKRLAESHHPAQRLVLVGTAAGHVEGTRQYDRSRAARHHRHSRFGR